MKQIKFANGKPIEVSDQNYNAIRRAIDKMLRLRCEIWQEQRRIDLICGVELAGWDNALAELDLNDDCLPGGDERDSVIADLLLDVRLMKIIGPPARNEQNTRKER